MEHTAIIWFRNDLRLHDNEAIVEALQKANNVIPLYVFDERIFLGKTSYGFEKISKFRTNFIIQAVTDLRINLRKIGSDLIIRIGKPEEEVFKLANEHKTSWVYCNRERTEEEVRVQDNLEKKLWTIGQELRFVRGKMLYHTADLPFPICQVPDVFTTYRKEIENIVDVRPPLETPGNLPFPKFDEDRGEVPQLTTFGKGEISNLHLENNKFIGGESAALQQLNEYLWENHHIDEYKNTRNQMIGWSFSSKLSAWLSAGCISPKMIVYEIKKYEQTVVKNESTYWIYFELLWRDFFRLMGKKYGNKIFHKSGIRNVADNGKEDIVSFNYWKNGMTGIPLIDANMRELNETGFMSNRGRQNVASFLIKDLQVTWLMGAEYFESQLIDYDPCSNYGNWNYMAGVGNDPREDRYFNVLSQAKRYDPNGDLIRYWIPELKNLPNQYIFQPDKMPIDVQAKYGVIIGKDYPAAVIDTEIWMSDTKENS